MLHVTGGTGQGMGGRGAHTCLCVLLATCTCLEAHSPFPREECGCLAGAPRARVLAASSQKHLGLGPKLEYELAER